MIRHVIEKMGIAIADAANGRTALAWLAEHPAPALILLDLMMPEMDGFEFLEAIAARPGMARYPGDCHHGKAAHRRRSGTGSRASVQKVIAKGAFTAIDVAAAVSERGATSAGAGRRKARMHDASERCEGDLMAKILLVEDNEMNRDMLSRRLTRRGFEVVIAVDGEQGVELARSEKPDIILMDMSLPVMDGWEATRPRQGRRGHAQCR